MELNPVARGSSDGDFFFHAPFPHPLLFFHNVREAPAAIRAWAYNRLQIRGVSHPAAFYSPSAGSGWTLIHVSPRIPRYPARYSAFATGILVENIRPQYGSCYVTNVPFSCHVVLSVVETCSMRLSVWVDEGGSEYSFDYRQELS